MHGMALAFSSMGLTMKREAKQGDFEREYGGKASYNVYHQNYTPGAAPTGNDWKVTWLTVDTLGMRDGNLSIPFHSRGKWRASRRRGNMFPWTRTASQERLG